MLMEDTQFSPNNGGWIATRNGVHGVGDTQEAAAHDLRMVELELDVQRGKRGNREVQGKS
jgi:hypothetical protein